MADDTNICDVVLYHLNSFHMYEELKEMIYLQFLANFKRQWKSQTLELNVGTIRGKCQPQLFLQQGVEKLGSGSVQCHCRLGQL